MLSMELVDPQGRELPPFAPGAHVDVTFSAGLVRQYSLCGDPADRTRYRIAVRSVDGGQASRIVHQALRPGDLLDVSAPRNNFALVKAENFLFIAGGIGITPLLPMIQAASRSGSSWRLLYCVRQSDAAAFLLELEALHGEISLHVTDAGTRLDVAAALAAPQANTALYCCGPESLMLAVEAATPQWPAGSLHFEWFTPRTRSDLADPGSFELVCAQSGLTLAVPHDRSVLSVLNDAGLGLSYSCEQGICGTCECRVLEGEVDHRDSILSAAEQAAHDIMMVCVSRARGARLVLDI